MNGFLLAILCAFGSGGYVEPHYMVDLIELNHRYMSDQDPFDQVIFWKYSAEYRRYDAMGWVLLNEKYGLVNYPVKVGELWKCTPGRPDRRTFVSKMFRETWTGHDPEQANRKLNAALPLKSIVEP